MTSFRPLCANALYTGTVRGLAADLEATSLLDGRPHAVCTSLITASHGHVTDVLPVPTDSVQAQLEHLFGVLPANERPTAVRLGIVSQAATVDTLFDALADLDELPTVLDLTLSGPSGEDIIDAAGLDAIKDRLDQPGLVSLRRQDAELVASMEIASLDDAQVAVQRLQRLGARAVLLRCGVLPARHFDENGARDERFFADLFYDGVEFHLFEAPYLEDTPSGASSVLSLALLRALQEGSPLTEAIQQAKRLVTEWLRRKVANGTLENTQ